MDDLKSDRLAGVVASAMDAIVCVDEEQQIILFNAAAERMFGYPAGKVLGKPLDMLLPERFRPRHKDHVRRFGASGQTGRRPGQLGEVVGLRASGEEFPIEAAVSQSGSSPHKVFAAFLRDLSARKQELRLHENHRWHADIVASVLEGIVSVDERQRIVLFNPSAERMFGRSAGETIGQPLGMLIPERFRAQHKEHIRRFVATGVTTRPMGTYGLIYGLRAAGEEFPIDATISQSGASPEKLLTVILRDATGRIRAEQERRDLTERLRLLARRLFETEESERRRVARELHDRVGGNVTALTLNLQRLRGHLSVDCLEKVRMEIDDCESLLSFTGRMVRDVTIDLRPPGLDELGLLAALHEHARRVAIRAGFSCTVGGAEATPRLPPAAEITLFRIAEEALVNVAKHARATEVQVTLEPGPARVALTVADNGCGFDAAGRPAQPGASLGMTSMRERAESLGGRLRVESAPGKGTRVIVEVPRG